MASVAYIIIVRPKTRGAVPRCLIDHAFVPEGPAASLAEKCIYAAAHEHVHPKEDLIDSIDRIGSESGTDMRNRNNGRPPTNAFPVQGAHR